MSVPEDYQDLYEEIEEYTGMEPPFVKGYREYVAENYPDLRHQFPLYQPFDIVVALINGDEAAIIYFIQSNQGASVDQQTQFLTYSVPEGSELSTTDYIKENENEIALQYIDYLNLSKIIGYTVVHPPFENKAEQLHRDGEELAKFHDEIHKQSHNLKDELLDQVGPDVLNSLSEAGDCIVQGMYQPAIATIAVAMEEALVKKLQDVGKNIKKEERNGTYYSLNELVKLAHEDYSLISQKTYERLKILNKIRRFGTHHKTGESLRGDAEFSLQLANEALDELYLD